MMDSVKMSRFLSYVLRHHPDSIGLALDSNGWANVDELIRLANRHGTPLTHTLLEELVAENDKQRFAFDEAGQRIRANQGHSVEIDLALTATEPPDLLFHGTAGRFVPSIRGTGLHSGNRHHVHLSLDRQTAEKVGQRHGKPVVLTIQAGAMHEAGHAFYLSANRVWLTELVPVQWIYFPND